jgi:hypothetical protein
MAKSNLNRLPVSANKVDGVYSVLYFILLAIKILSISNSPADFKQPQDFT